ncbi:MAG TPA: hypothetical protein VII06_15815 [Chloroflexota bacterium]|jgi:membrane protein involved in colicin uptake
MPDNKSIDVSSLITLVDQTADPTAQAEADAAALADAARTAQCEAVVNFFGKLAAGVAAGGCEAASHIHPRS